MVNDWNKARVITASTLFAFIAFIIWRTSRKRQRHDELKKNEDNLEKSISDLQENDDSVDCNELEDECEETLDESSENDMTSDANKEEFVDHNPESLQVDQLAALNEFGGIPISTICGTSSIASCESASSSKSSSNDLSMSEELLNDLDTLTLKDIIQSDQVLSSSHESLVDLDDTELDKTSLENDQSLSSLNLTLERSTPEASLSNSSDVSDNLDDSNLYTSSHCENNEKSCDHHTVKSELVCEVSDVDDLSTEVVKNEEASEPNDEDEKSVTAHNGFSDQLTNSYVSSDDNSDTIFDSQKVVNSGLVNDTVLEKNSNDDVGLNNGTESLSSLDLSSTHESQALLSPDSNCDSCKSPDMTGVSENAESSSSHNDELITSGYSSLKDGTSGSLSLKSSSDKEINLNGNNNTSEKQRPPSQNSVATDASCSAWRANTSSSSNEEPASQRSRKDLKSRKSNHQTRGRGFENEKFFEIIVEFPNSKVGLLIGKNGKNIKQLKQDSKVEIYIHQSPNKDDVQILQIQGKSADVTRCIAIIKQKFEIQLTCFDRRAFNSPTSQQTVDPVVLPEEASNLPATWFAPVATKLPFPEKKLVDINISAISNINQIFVQQCQDISFHHFQNFNSYLQAWYSQTVDAPSIPTEPSALEFYICVVKQAGYWYRAKVIEYLEKTDEISFYFVDYGGFGVVPFRDAKQIRNDFLQIPFQATECYLANVSPFNVTDESNRENFVKFQTLLSTGSFKALAINFTSDGNPIIRLFRLSPTGLITQINAEIVKSELASWIPEDSAPEPQERNED